MKRAIKFINMCIPDYKTLQIFNLCEVYEISPIITFVSCSVLLFTFCRYTLYFKLGEKIYNMQNVSCILRLGIRLFTVHTTKDKNDILPSVQY
jgi:hypothetical protein